MFNHTGTNYIFAPAIASSGAGTGTVRVEAGTTILTATSTYTGPTVINGGTLSVNGSIACSAVTVNAGGTLGGNGTVGNTTINGGALAPGNSIGLLTVNGSLSFTAASSYMVEVSPTNADRVNVTGTATLGGATVNASFAAGSLCREAIHHPQCDRRHRRQHVRVGRQHQFAVGLQVEPELRCQQRLSESRAELHRAARQRPERQSSQGVGNALVNYFNRNGGIPLVYRRADARPG